MVSSFTARGVALAGLLVAAMSNGCVRFGSAVIGGDGAVDSASSALDVASDDTPDRADASALDAPLPDAPLPDAPLPDAPLPDAPLPDAPEAAAPDVPVVDAPPVDAPAGCVQNDDCADPLRPLCNASTGRCVGCLSSPDTCPLRRYCDATTETCLNGCLDDRDCAPIGSADAGSRPSRCDLARHACVECVVNVDCPIGGVCVGGACAMASCVGAFGDCDGRADNGCETSLRSTDHCGECGRACVAPPHAAPTCDAALGVCGFTCAAGFADCDGSAATGCESDLASDLRSCGACGAACDGGTVCADGTCVPRPGTTLITGATVINTVNAAVSGAAGSSTLRLGEGVGAFAAGALVLVHQTQSRAGDAGRYELRRVTATGAGTLTLDAPLSRGYTTDPAAGARAQAVAVQPYMDLYVTASGALSAPEWNGRYGGILAVDVAGDAVIEGRVSMDGRGFRGSSHACAEGLYRCLSGVSGESPTGPGTAGRSANGGGGGGGGSGADCGAGGGGAYGTSGASGADGDCNGESDGGMCATGCPNPGGVGGGAYGGADLSMETQLGSAGGEGGGDEDGETPGGGGNGGGIVWLRAGRTLEVPGTITAAGSAGLDGNQSGCGVGDGCGMGGGGGGSGGAVRLAAATRVTLGTDRVRAPGGGGGVCSCGRIDRPERSFPGGLGGVGRVGVASARVEGATAPVYDPR
jgi:hypothetical protein